jgi:hypothetical protein
MNSPAEWFVLGLALGIGLPAWCRLIADVWALWRCRRSLDALRRENERLIREDEGRD